MTDVRTAAVLAIAAAIAFACLSASTTAANVTSGCVTQSDAAADYFPDKAAIHDAANFRVEYHRSYKTVTIKGAVGGGPPERYLLVQCGAPSPANEPAVERITVPITSLYASSATHLGPLADLGRLDVVTGVSRLSDLPDDAIRPGAATRQVREFAAASVIDAELVVSGQPSMLMTGSGATSALAAIRAAGVPVVVNVEWLEQTALARAEWIKLIAVFLNEERKATALYDAMKGRYQALRTRANAATPKPLVMTGRSTNGRFVIAGGRSYVASLIVDAGGRYVWADDTAVGAAVVDLEAQIERAANADIWINGGGWRNLAAMLQDEPRYTAFKAYRSGQVWVYERRLQPSGTNDYWARSISRPDLVLSDLVRIVHPSLLDQHRLEWYMPVPRQ
jgi:iron complex transport system substrate-binding protein